jgi:hypothetical protein
MARNRLKTKLWCSSRQYRSDLTYCPEELRRLRCRLTDDIAPKRSELELPGWKVHWGPRCAADIQSCRSRFLDVELSGVHLTITGLPSCNQRAVRPISRADQEIGSESVAARSDLWLKSSK